MRVREFDKRLTQTDQSGFSMIEMLIAIVVVTFGLVSIVGISAYVSRANSVSATLNVLAAAAQDQVDRLRTARWTRTLTDPMLSVPLVVPSLNNFWFFSLPPSLPQPGVVCSLSTLKCADPRSKDIKNLHSNLILFLPPPLAEAGSSSVHSSLSIHCKYFLFSKKNQTLNLPPYYHPFLEFAVNIEWPTPFPKIVRLF